MKEYHQSEKLPPDSLPGNLPGRFLFLFVALALIFSFALISTLKHEVADEGFHTPVVYEYYNGNFIVSEHLTMLPVYHAVVAGILSSVDFISVKAIRLVSLLLSSMAILALYRICLRTHPEDVDSRVLLFTLCPIIIPFFSLIYTDMIAALFVLFMVLSMLKGWHVLAALLGLAAVLFRQTSFVWIGFCALYMMTELWVSHVGPFKARARQVAGVLFWNMLPYALAMSAFLIFVYFNGGVTVGAEGLHNVSLNPSNVYYYLLLSFFLLLPYNLEYARKCYDLLRTHPLLWIAFAGAFLVYTNTYSNSHPFNAYGLSFYIRNIILHHTVANPILKTLAFVPMCWMAVTFYLMAKESPRPWQLYCLYASTLIALVPLPLVEQRYYMAAFALFLAWKPQTSPAIDAWTIGCYIPLSAVTLYGISQQLFFL